mgnify:CR=1 FL=1
MTDIEDVGKQQRKLSKLIHTHSISRKRKRVISNSFSEEDLSRHWKEVLGPSPSIGKTRVFIKY